MTRGVDTVRDMLEASNRVLLAVRPVVVVAAGHGRGPGRAYAAADGPADHGPHLLPVQPVDAVEGATAGRPRHPHGVPVAASVLPLLRAAQAADRLGLDCPYLTRDTYGPWPHVTIVTDWTRPAVEAYLDELAAVDRTWHDVTPGKRVARAAVHARSGPGRFTVALSFDGDLE